MERFRLLIYLFLCLAEVPEVTSYTTSSASSLYTAITYNYNNLLRPSGTTNVSVGFNLRSINFLDVTKQQFSVTGWLDVQWTDSRFTWVPSSYSNINELFLSYSVCWNPKLIIDNLVDDVYILDDSALLFRASYTGQVDWVPSGEFTVFCAADITYYPFDTQECYISVKSWSFDSATVELSFLAYDVGQSQYEENDEWKLESTSLTSGDVTQNTLTYSNLKFNFKLRRRAQSLLIWSVLPFVLTSFLGFWVFAIPPESESKIGYSIAVFIAEAIFYNIVVADFPTSGNHVPLLGSYLLLVVTLSICETLMTLMVIKLYHNKDRKRAVTRAVERMCVIMSAITCYKETQTESTNGRSSTACDSIEAPSTIEVPPDFKVSIVRRPSLKSISPDCSFATTRNGDLSKESERPRAWSEASGLCSGRGVFKKLTWVQVASIVDRFCLLVCLFLRLTLTIIILTIVTMGAT